MIQISNLKLQIPHTTKRLKEKALKQLHGKSRCCIMSIHWNCQ